MQGSDLIYIVMPVVILLALVVLIALPFASARGSSDSRSGSGHAHGRQSQGQIPGDSVAPDASGNDMADLSRAQRVANAHSHVPAADVMVSGSAAGNENTHGITTQPTGGSRSVS